MGDGFRMMVGGLLPRWLRVSKPGGLVFGASGSVMVRELVMFKSDLTRTAWFRNGDSPPQVALPGDLRMRWLPREEWLSKPEILDIPPETVDARYQMGDRCLIGLDTDTGQVVYRLWASEKGAYTGWIFAFVEALPGHILIHDVWAHPDYRGGNLHWAGASLASREAVRCRRPGIYGGFEEYEFLAHAAKYASLGLGLPTPHASLLGIKFFALEMHIRRPPPLALVELSRKLRARYPAIYIENDIAHRHEPAAADCPA